MRPYPQLTTAKVGCFGEFMYDQTVYHSNSLKKHIHRQRILNQSR